MMSEKLPTPPKELLADLVPTIEDLVVARLHVEADPNCVPDGPVAKIHTIFSLQVARMGTLKRQVQFACAFGRNKSAAEVPTTYQGQIVVYANLAVKERANASPLEVDLACAWTSISSVVGMTRSYLDLVTAVGPYQRVLLSPVSQGKLIAGATTVREDGSIVPLLGPIQIPETKETPVKSTVRSRKRK